jgi:hypothetical protein
VADQGPTGQSPTEEELLAALDQIGVRDVLVQALATSVSIGFRRVSAEARDLPQARLAIESLRALEPVLRENGVDEALVRDLEQARANLQLAYATAVAEARSTEGRPAKAAASSEEHVADRGPDGAPGDDSTQRAATSAEGASSGAAEGGESEQGAGEGAPSSAREERTPSQAGGESAAADVVVDAADEGASAEDSIERAAGEGASAEDGVDDAAGEGASGVAGVDDAAGEGREEAAADE